ncbi:inclusion membrane protein IncE [Chlamydia sp.]|uniref:inclusion membrane protein IncE n=1 Tax=Chlamydia sp. TaxID=35827 RepID=UPI0025C3E043|nr:inclusion membrane protein IncE [Chlamydia sp.]MBQ8498740.1 inclusion membrane protein IncE [Chlamydia sp.]
MDCIKQLCRDNLCLDKITVPVRSLMTNGSTRDKVQAASGVFGVIVSMACLVLGIMALIAGCCVAGWFSFSAGIVALLLGIVVFCISTLEVLERHGLGCPLKPSLPKIEPSVLFVKGKDGLEDSVLTIG